MRWFADLAAEFVGLFVDDESFAAAILAWLAGAVVCLKVFHVPPMAEGVLLAAGFALLLAENVERTAREYRP